MDLEEERRDLEDANTELCKKLCESNDEIREAQQELISGLRGLSDESSMIRVKMMGRVDKKPFLKVCEERFSGQDVALQHDRLFSKWQERVLDSRWEPFKIQRSGDKIVVLFMLFHLISLSVLLSVLRILTLLLCCC
ncbi:hypothetical protein HA466_0039490 [Hirschfeldia incana]|nr:hypothetical protein HA466_0039490 [Hirschfeldia incana]